MRMSSIFVPSVCKAVWCVMGRANWFKKAATCNCLLQPARAHVQATCTCSEVTQRSVGVLHVRYSHLPWKYTH